ncbi:DUF1648 domain-containing protein [Desulfosporosinus fructosivorans]|uniref:DUF1648 domain-containing protein n=1 Tax=Desulfosporosinus fructosivorans TaxID=2018669 RepID=A0A4Z0R6Z2_9FIRM|nr:DUF1648 domain-containing protein [Desulfosporosinus fructosivorans]TGE38155.1 DUF1648 domain-containing protein [Desulfosporosinus fructosivorans]
MIENSSTEKRPRLEIHRSFLENIFEIGALIGVIASLISPIRAWSSLPSKIPAHYNIYGEIDRWGSKGEIFLLVPIIILMYIFLTVLNHYPHRFNYPFAITEQNAEEQYRLARLMVQVLKVEVIWIFFYIEWISIKAAMSKAMGLGKAFMIISLILVFSTIGVYIWRAFRVK